MVSHLPSTFCKAVVACLQNWPIDDYDIVWELNNCPFVVDICATLALVPERGP